MIYCYVLDIGWLVSESRCVEVVASDMCLHLLPFHRYKHSLILYLKLKSMEGIPWHHKGNLNTATKQWWALWSLHSLESPRTYFSAFLSFLRTYLLAAHAPKQAITSFSLFLHSFSVTCVRPRILRWNHSEISNAKNYGEKGAWSAWAMRLNDRWMCHEICSPIQHA